MWFDWLHHCPMGVQGWERWSLVGWVYGGLGLHLGVAGDGGGRCPLFISQTTSSIFVGCLWPDRSGSGHDDFLVARQRRAAEDCYVHSGYFGYVIGQLSPEGQCH